MLKKWNKKILGRHGRDFGFDRLYFCSGYGWLRYCDFK